MNFNPSQAPAPYDQSDQNRFRNLLKQFLAGVLRTDRDVELQPTVRLILTDADGQRWAFTVDTSGNLQSTAL